jgi:hypothetical protein
VDGQSKSSATLSPTGTATFSTASLAVGTHVITAAYAGNPQYHASSARLTVGVGKSGTATILYPSADDNAFGQPITLVAEVLGGVSPTGSVTFYIDGIYVGTGKLNSQGKATLVVPTAFRTIMGLHVAAAFYWGDGQSFPSFSQGVSFTVHPAQVQLQLKVRDLVPNVYLDLDVTAVGLPSANDPYLDGVVIVEVDGDLRFKTTTRAFFGSLPFRVYNLFPGPHSFLVKLDSFNYGTATATLDVTVPGRI